MKKKHPKCAQNKCFKGISEWDFNKLSDKMPREHLCLEFSHGIKWTSEAENEDPAYIFYSSISNWPEER